LNSFSSTFRAFIQHPDELASGYVLVVPPGRKTKNHRKNTGRDMTTKVPFGLVPIHKCNWILLAPSLLQFSTRTRAKYTPTSCHPIKINHCNQGCLCIHSSVTFESPYDKAHVSQIWVNGILTFFKVKCRLPYPQWLSCSCQ
jgi:hypothetical protein